MKKEIIFTLIITFGIILSAWFIKNGLNSIATGVRTVTVKGLAEKEVKANKVIWPITIKYFDNDVTTLYKKVKETNQKVNNYLLSKGVKQDEISVNPASITDTKAEMYSDNNKARYYGTSVITVTSKDVDKIRSIINKQSEMLSIGIVPITSYDATLIYSYTDLNKIKPQMIQEATKNARESAQKFAKDSESDLGKIKTANQGIFEIEDRDSNTPYIKKIRVVTTIIYYLSD